ncbi:hypothetical protein BDP27DRAFT_1367074 [Rhodocollybia butyracea]|uniref:Indole-diterpene biosynthesis protein PaxU n=1 Tax=Rhodocollybia butyracea TaxID=206335 RepID=A0A9P5U3J6_9AGAR|nr:hypothetical protein BDP27DRAFT_1367074 [Rhodocollybia butyracea]
MHQSKVSSVPVPIGKGIYLRNGSSFGFSSSIPKPDHSNDPNFILIFGWMGAKLPHLIKYMNVYEEMYPHATQILVQCPPEFFFSFHTTKMNNLIPVAKLLEDHGNKTARILAHSFSNGGGMQMYTLGTLLRSRGSLRNGTPQRIVSALILDSSPGVSSLNVALRSFTASIPNVLLRIPMIFMVTLLYGLHAINRRLLRARPFFDELKSALLNGDDGDGILPWMNKTTPRIYMCSRKDELVLVEDVRRHVDEAKRRNLKVKIEVFEDTPHVAHARKYPERYWGAVKDLWASAIHG